MLDYKSQIRIPKSQNIFFFANCKLVPCSLFVIYALFFGIFTNVFAANIEKAKIYFLSSDYKDAIKEGEKLMAQPDLSQKELDELYYILGLSYLKDGNYLRSSDIFEIIINEIAASRYKDDALMGLGDTYFLRGDYDKAEENYKKLLSKDPKSRLVPQLLYRLSECSIKNGNSAEAEAYIARLKKEYPSNADMVSDRDVPFPELFYTVQVGSFSKPGNAENLVKRLKKSDYDAFSEESYSGGRKIYRVKVGKFKLRSQAAQLENKLAQEGYPTKIFP